MDTKLTDTKLTDTNIINFNKQLNNFIRDLKESFPEDIELINKNYNENIPDDNDEYIIHFDNISKDYPDKISSKEDAVLSLGLIKHLDISHFYFKEDISKSTQETIWKYISCMYLNCFLYKNKDLLKDNQNNKFMGILNNLKETIGDDVQDEKECIDKLFENNQFLSGELGNLTKDIMKDINLDDLTKNMDPMSMITQLMNPNSINTEDTDNPMVNLIQSITSKVQTKLSDGNIDEQKLFNDAQNISQNNLFSGLLNNMTQGGNPFGSSQEQMNNTNTESSLQPQNTTHKRLQKKLKNKQKNNNSD